jgi:hypothetical protein
MLFHLAKRFCHPESMAPGKGSIAFAKIRCARKLHSSTSIPRALANHFGLLVSTRTT